jgi:hypothetical protein
MDEGTCRAADAHDWCGEKDRGRYFAADLGRLAPSARRGLALPCRAGPGLGCTASREPDSSGAQAKGFLLPKFLVTAALVTVCGSCGCANAGGLRAGGGAGGAAAAAFVAPSASLRGALAARHLPTCVHAPALARGPLPQPFPGAPLVRAGACEGLLALRADGGGEEAPGELAGAGQMARQRPAPSSGALRSSRRRTGRQRRREGGSGGGGGGGAARGGGGGGGGGGGRAAGRCGVVGSAGEDRALRVRRRSGSISARLRTRRGSTPRISSAHKGTRRPRRRRRPQPSGGGSAGEALRASFPRRVWAQRSRRTAAARPHTPSPGRRAPQWAARRWRPRGAWRPGRTGRRVRLPVRTRCGMTHASGAPRRAHAHRFPPPPPPPPPP